MSKDWHTTTIGESCAIFSGGTPAKSNAHYWIGDIPWVSAKDLKFDQISDSELHISTEACKDSSTKMAGVGSLLVLVRGMGLANGVPIGEVMVPVAFNQDIRAIVPPDSVLPRFLLLALRSALANGDDVDVLSAAAHGTLKIDADALRRIRYPIPPLLEQQRIVAILDEAFDSIAIARANAEKSLQSARELFDAHLTAIFQQAGALLPLSAYAASISDGDHAPPPKSSAGVPFITISNVDKETRQIDFSDTFTVSRAYFDSLKPHRRPKAGDVLYTVTGSFGIPILIEDDREFCFQRHIGLIRPNHDVDSRWLTYALLSPAVFKQADEGATGTAQRTGSLGVLRSITLPVVSIADQRAAASRLDALAAEVGRLKHLQFQKLTALDELKKSLLHQAFSGQLTDAKPVGVSEQSALQTATPEFAAHVICFAYARHERQKREKTFGRVKEQKLLQFVESIGGIDLGRHPIKDAAGPNDFAHMLRVEAWAKEHNVFELVERGKGKGYDFRKLEAFDKGLSTALEALKPYQRKLESVIDLLVPMDSDDAKVFATVHAAWNNLLLDGVDATDDAIVFEARENWHADKLKIPESRFRSAIALIRENGVVPDGTAKYVGGQTSLL